MWSNLLVLHSEAKNKELFSFPGLFHWKTCMRTVYIGDTRVIDKSILEKEDHSPFQVHTGYEGYRLLLMIVSGIRSRLLGETEVLAQFKENFKDGNLPNSTFGEYLRKLKNELIEDSRKIRSGHLTSLGDQSYGGMAHRYLKEEKEVALIGTGQLAEKILPWLLENKRNVIIVGRNLERLNFLKDKFQVKISLLENYTPTSESIIVAAPFSIQSIGQKLQPGKLLVDFREDDCADHFPSDIKWISFASMLQTLKEREERNEELRKKLEIIASQIANEREYDSHHSVFCWEDLHCIVNSG